MTACSIEVLSNPAVYRTFFMVLVWTVEWLICSISQFSSGLLHTLVNIKLHDNADNTGIHWTGTSRQMQSEIDMVAFGVRFSSVQARIVRHETFFLVHQWSSEYKTGRCIHCNKPVFWWLSPCVFKLSACIRYYTVSILVGTGKRVVKCLN